MTILQVKPAPRPLTLLALLASLPLAIAITLRIFPYPTNGQVLAFEILVVLLTFSIALVCGAIIGLITAILGRTRLDVYRDPNDTDTRILKI